MKRRGLIFIISLACALGVLAFFPKKTDRQYYFTDGWREEIPGQFVFAGKPAGDAAVFSFTGGGMFGYCTEEGGIIYSEPVVYGVTGSSEYFINYSSVSETLLVKNSVGEIVSTISTVGYPLIRNGRLFILDVDRCGIAEWDFTGRKLWGKRYSSIITCFDCDEQGAVVGLINGNIFLYNTSGEYIYRDEFTGSRVRAVYGTALSPGGAYFAVIEGIGPQKLVLFQRREEGYVPVFSKELENAIRRELFMQFSDSASYLFYEQEEALYRLAVNRKKPEKQFPLTGRPIQIAFSRPYGIQYIHSENREEAVIDVYNDGGMRVNRIFVDPGSTAAFHDTSIFFQRDGFMHQLYIGEYDGENL